MSTVENSIQISLIQTELAKKVTFAQMSDTQKRQVIDQLFPEGVAFWYTDPKIQAGDKVFLWGDPAINSGGFVFGEALTAPIQSLNDIDQKLEF